MSNDLEALTRGADGAPIPQQQCPGCGARLNAAGGLDVPIEARPRPGNASVCIRCGSFLVFKEDYMLRLMTEQEVAELDDDQRIEMLRMRATVAALGP